MRALLAVPRHLLTSIFVFAAAWLLLAVCIQAVFLGHFRTDEGIAISNEAIVDGFLVLTVILVLIGICIVVYARITKHREERYALPTEFTMNENEPYVPAITVEPAVVYTLSDEPEAAEQNAVIVIERAKEKAARDEDWRRAQGYRIDSSFGYVVEDYSRRRIYNKRAHNLLVKLAQLHELTGATVSISVTSHDKDCPPFSYSTGSFIKATAKE